MLFLNFVLFRDRDYITFGHLLSQIHMSSVGCPSVTFVNHILRRLKLSAMFHSSLFKAHAHTQNKYKNSENKKWTDNDRQKVYT